MADGTNHIKTLDEPAFPVTLPETDDEGFRTHFPGMTLRDWFAGQALTGLLSIQNPSNTINDDAAIAYAYADAMIAARVLSGGSAS